MSTYSENEQINLLADKLADLIGLFRNNNNSTHFNFWNDTYKVFQPNFGCPEAKPLFDELISRIVKLNPKMLSASQTERKLVYDFIQFQTIEGHEHATGKELTEMSRKKISELADFSETHYVQIPIYNLMLLRNVQYNLLGITLRKATETDVKHYKREFKGVGMSPSDVHSFACVNVEGDNTISISEAIAKIRRLFDFIRAFCFPFGKGSEAWNTGIFGDIPLRSSIPMIIDQSQYPFISNQRNQQIELETHILPKLTDEQWQLLDLIKEQMPKRLCDSIHWLAEATKPDTNNTKFVKISIALETLLGKESKDDNLKVRSITAMLAERAAFIAGNDCNDRLFIDQIIRKFYGIRSSTLHGEGKEVSSKDIDGFGNLVRRISLAIITELNIKKENIADSEKLENWIKKQKYTLPENKEDL